MSGMTIEQALAVIQSEVSYHAGSDTHYRAEKLDQSLATLRAEIARLEKDAARWRHARKLLTVDDIEGAQGAFDSFGGMVSEEECARADAAIDAAKGASYD